MPMEETQFEKEKKKQKEKMDLGELRKWYEEELIRRDKQIEKLREENKILMKMSLKQSEKLQDLNKRLEDSLKQ